VSNFENLTTTVEKVDWIAVARDFFEKEQRTPLNHSKNETIYICKTEKQIAAKIHDIKHGFAQYLLQPFTQIFGEKAMTIVKTQETDWVAVAKDFYKKEQRTPVQRSKNETIYISQTEKQIAKKINKIKDGKAQNLLQPFKEIFGAEEMKVKEETDWLPIAKEFYRQEQRLPTCSKANEKDYFGKTERDLGGVIVSMRRGKAYKNFIEPFKAIFGSDFLEK
jgi:hypothetical protein